ncbi:hypothetical protein OE88DRAFT_1493749 [Heliocybe sulcata]|uniref:Uncharacterized protein n=1 Tax=Heliocybe sulcata TaxID=5364 RepID=A0A5C3N547_9AGAM|nr:hypothetical protein OE88DRAFT_1493749 [Heliocybe sulcata]
MPAHMHHSVARFSNLAASSRRLLSLFQKFSFIYCSCMLSFLCSIFFSIAPFQLSLSLLLSWLSLHLRWHCSYGSHLTFCSPGSLHHAS